MSRCPNCRRPIEPGDTVCSFCEEPLERQHNESSNIDPDRDQEKRPQSGHSQSTSSDGRAQSQDFTQSRPPSSQAPPPQGTQQQGQSSKTQQKQTGHRQNQKLTQNSAPDFLLNNEKVIKTLTVSPWNPLNRTKYKYYLTDKRVIQTTSTLSSTELEDIPHDEIVSVEEKSDTLMSAIIGGGIVSAGLTPISMMIANLTYADVRDFTRIGKLLADTWHAIIVVWILAITISIIFRQSHFDIKTANPEVSMSISTRGSGTQEFIREVRKETRRK